MFSGSRRRPTDAARKRPSLWITPGLSVRTPMVEAAVERRHTGDRRGTGRWA
ncbi:hypothetical protein SHJG_5718 [Streptomyces hygroscopicus subsp. jinggangensis 5008]|nr:hypothetical protein SHJG_5718 [Streptomyces hygroscopicus subsp. jinggangensis 5008]AGF65142.1 hypothetical protein SHJGH_5479 [Streptomyces hygroscopicus subsp. jinggangensis TL01]